MKCMTKSIFCFCILFGLTAQGRFLELTPRHDKWEKNSVLACATYLTQFEWDHSKGPRYYSTLCSYEPAFGSWTICINHMINENNRLNPQLLFNKSIETVRECCSCAGSQTGISMEYYYNSLYNASLHTKIDDGNIKDAFVTYPITVNETMRRKLGNAYHFHAYNLDISNYYGVLLSVFFVCVFIISTFFNYVDHTGLNTIVFKFKVLNYIRGYLTLPTLLTHHAEYSSYKNIIIGLFPTRLESIILFSYLLLHMLLLCIDYHYDPYNLLFKSKSLQLTRLLADRAGILAFAQFPLIILFSTRNNVFEFFTGFRYSTFIMFHKWIGRIMVLDSMLHGVCYSIYALRSKIWETSAKQLYWQFGVFSLWVALIMLILSLGIVRRHYYETFLYTHIVLAILFFYSCWKHVAKLGWKEWIVASLVIWTMERITRVIRMINFGFPSAKLQLFGEDLIKVTIPKGNWKIQPGQYAYAYFMHPLIFWQSHPYTVMEAKGSLELIVRAKKGASKTIWKSCVKNGGSMKMRISLEGPYGLERGLHTFHSVLFLAGGTGLPGPLFHAIELGTLLTNGSKKTIHLMIVVRGQDILQAFRHELNKLKELKVEVTIYNTESEPTSAEHATDLTLQRESAVDSNTPLLSTRNTLSELQNFVQVFNRRPKIEKIIRTECRASKSLAIVTCGPPKFVDNIRNLTAKQVISNPDHDIEYFEEFQCW